MSGRTQVIRPAGAGHETLYVLLAALLIAVIAAGVVALRGERVDEVAIASHQIDARRDLTPAEQGLYTDLTVALDEILALRDDNAEVPGVATLAAEGLPPFVVDASSESRGRHQWRLLGSDAYVGRSQDIAVAGSFVLILPQDSTRVADIWLRRAANATLPTRLDAQALSEAGWQQIVSHYDAGVTREHRH